MNWVFPFITEWSPRTLADQSDVQYESARKFQFRQLIEQNNSETKQQRKRLRISHHGPLSSNPPQVSSMSIDSSFRSISSLVSSESFSIPFEMDSLQLFDNLLQTKPTYKHSISTSSYEKARHKLHPIKVLVCQEVEVYVPKDIFRQAPRGRSNKKERHIFRPLSLSR